MRRPAKINEHPDPKIVTIQMLIRLNQITSIFFFFLLLLFKDDFSSAKITFAILRDARLFGGFTATDATLGHFGHLLSWVNLTDEGSLCCYIFIYSVRFDAVRKTGAQETLCLHGQFYRLL